MTSSKLKKSDQHPHDMTQIEGGHVDYRVGAVPGPDSVNRRVSGPGTEPGLVPGLARLKWAICKRGLWSSRRQSCVIFFTLVKNLSKSAGPLKARARSICYICYAVDPAA